VAEMTGFHTISVHVWHFLTIPSLKGRGGGAVRPRVYRDHVYSSCSSVLSEMVCHQTVVVGWVTPGLKPIAPQGVGQWWPAVMGTWRSSDSYREGMTHLFVGPRRISLLAHSPVHVVAA